MVLNEIDLKVIRHLMEQGRITWSELATILELSAPATADRVRRLEERHVIKGYAALIDPVSMGLDLAAFVFVTLDRPEHRATFAQRVQELPEIQECHHVTGNDDYLLKVRCRSTRELEQLVSENLKSLPGVLKTRTTIVLSTVKETASLPLPSHALKVGD